MITQEAFDRAHEGNLSDLDELVAAGDTLAGWKLGLTSGSHRDAFGPGVRPFGYLLASRVLRSGATLWWDKVIETGVLESELCFQIAADVTTTVDEFSVVAHLRAVAPAFEINQRRLGSNGDATGRIRDNLSNWGLAVGAPQSLPVDWDQSQVKVSALHNADGVSTVTGAGHIDDHFSSIACLANQLLRFDRCLLAGQWVITGSYTRVEEPGPGLWSGDFGALGRVHLRIER